MIGAVNGVTFASSGPVLGVSNASIVVYGSYDVCTIGSSAWCLKVALLAPITRMESGELFALGQRPLGSSCSNR